MMETQITASTSTGTPDIDITSFDSWFDVRSFQEFVGRGSFGFVFKAVTVEGLSAVKITFLDAIGKSKDETKKDILRISREYELIRDKEHGNLVKILKSTETKFNDADFKHIINLNCITDEYETVEFIETQRKRVKRGKQIFTFCTQMELCGENLRQWLNSDRFRFGNPELHQFQIKIITGLATGLNYLHENNIMHRDFRPENVMFTYSETEKFALPIKIGDFGLCRKVHSTQTKTNTLTSRVGHDLYSAPEVVGNDYGKQSDLFSFGLVVWEVMQLNKLEDIGRMFFKLVQESVTDVIKVKHVYMKGAIVSLTKRLTTDRAHVIPKYFIQVYSKKSIIIVENEEELRWALEICKPGDTIKLTTMSIFSPQIQLNTNNVTLRSKKGAKKEIVNTLNIIGDGCTIKHLKFKSLQVIGNSNSIIHSASSYVELKGNDNKVTDSSFEGRGKVVEISGDNNFMKQCKVHCVEGDDNVLNLALLKSRKNLGGIIMSGSKKHYRGI